MSVSEKIFKLAFRFLEQEPKAAARLLEEREPQSVAAFLGNTPPELVARVLRVMSPATAAQVLINANPVDATVWMQDIPNNAIAAVLRYLDHDSRATLLSHLSAKKKSGCELLLSYRSDMVGAWLESDVAVFPADMTIDDAIKRLKRRHYREDKLIFAVDDNRQLVGRVSLMNLLRSSPMLNVGNIALPYPEPVSGRALLSRVVRHPVWDSSDYAPVVNRQRELLGVIWYSQVRDLLSGQHLHVQQSPHAGANLAVDMLHIHGESMRAMLDVLINSSR